jgi:UDP-3-O-[3-hydroxymyristoyl] N-acetylglucosamine deacetylase
MVQRQRTIRQKATLSGTGLHTGQTIRMTAFPTSENEGIVFMRPSGQKLIDVPALASSVIDTRLATTLGKDGEMVATVEHFLAALAGLGIDNLRVEIDGPEVPIMDGSASAFVDLIRDAGIETQTAQKKFWVVTKPVLVQVGDRRASLKPASQFSIACDIDFNHPVISAQSYTWEFSDQAFHRELARARTFGLLKDVEMLKGMGLAQGGSLDNAIVVDDFSILNPEGLRYPDEFVRHKLLDGLGDVYLLGHPLIGKLALHKAGHALHHLLLEKAIKMNALELYEASPHVQSHTHGETELSLPVWAAPHEVFA